MSRYSWVFVLHDVPCGETIIRADGLGDKTVEPAVRKIAESFGFKWEPKFQWWAGTLKHGVEPLESHLRHAGLKPKVETRQCEGHYRPPAFTLALPSADWATAMFNALPTELRVDAYRALARVLHPDAGGDVEAAKTLNAAWTKLTKPGVR